MPLDSRSSRCQIFTFHNNADSDGMKKKSDTRAPYQTASTEADSSSSSLLVVDWRRGQLSSGVYLSPVPVEDDISQKGDSVAGRAGSLLQMDSRALFFLRRARDGDDRQG